MLHVCCYPNQIYVGTRISNGTTLMQFLWIACSFHGRDFDIFPLPCSLNPFHWYQSLGWASASRAQWQSRRHHHYGIWHLCPVPDHSPLIPEPDRFRHRSFFPVQDWSDVGQSGIPACQKNDIQHGRLRAENNNMLDKVRSSEIVLYELTIERR